MGQAGHPQQTLHPRVGAGGAPQSEKPSRTAPGGTEAPGLTYLPQDLLRDII